MQPELPITPYNGTGGYAGTDTSRERAEREAADGTLADRQHQILDYLLHCGVVGGTWHQLSIELELHHGQVSGALSNLHKAGEVFMLRQRHNRSHPYVHNKYRAFYSDAEVHDSPKTTKAGRRRVVIDELVAACRDAVDGGFTEERQSKIAELLGRYESSI